MRHAKKKDANKLVLTGALALGGVVVAAAPAGAASVSDWDKVAQCESGGRWNLPYGDASSTGGLQFQTASWKASVSYLGAHGVNTASYPSMPYEATKRQQIIAGEALLAAQGPGAWTCNAMVGSPLQSSGPHGSMFKGGISPYAAAPSAPSTPSPAPSVPATNPAAPSKAPEPSPVAPKGAGSTTGAKTHTVAPGDTLYGITKRYTGDASLDNWKPLYAANRGIIGDDPDLIIPGQKLRLPWSYDKPAAPATTAPAPSSSPSSTTAKYVKPVDARVSQGFHNPGAGYTLGYHTGTDFSAPAGTPVHAAAAGVVVASDPSGAYGTNVQIKHADGRYTLYAHLSVKSLTPGMKVEAGDLVGRVGSTGTSSGPHLHFEVRTAPVFAAGNFLDPVAWLRSHGVTV